jgi:3-dehydroquinate synthase/2-deoxy-scyllo-inosose synthase
MTTRTLDIEFGHIRVPVLLGTGATLDRAATDAIRALEPDRVLLVVDAGVAHLYPAEVRRFAGLGTAPGVIFVAPEGERCKTFGTLGEVIETFIHSGATKRSLVLVLGGGAAMNLGGLAAALIYRGLKLCYVPTTLMAQNDVVPSMKTAVNGCDRKNNIGTFYPASLSVVDSRYLHTLPEPELRAGMGEIIKNALILGGAYFDIAARMVAAHNAGKVEDALLVEIVESGIRAKLPALLTDPRESTTGMIFEYGHTVGHALELCYPTGVLPHGLAICWGMRCCSYVASRLGLMPADQAARHDDLIQALVPEPLPRPLPTLTDVMSRVMRDSKRGNTGEAVHECACVLLAAVGEPVATDTMLSKFPSALVADWLRDQGLRG